MTFKEPAALLGLLLVAALVGGYLFAQRRRRRFVLRFTDVALVQSVVGKSPGRRKHVPPALFLLGAAALVIAAAQPVLNLEVARNDASVILVIDTSGSMAATDVSPTRMDAARAAGHSLVQELPGQDRVGLVSFNGTATLQVKLTDNRDDINSALDNLQPGGATAIGDAITLAVRQFPTPQAGQKRPPSLIVLLTDGVSNRGTDPVAAAADAKSAGIPVDTIGIGSRDPNVQVFGEPIGGVDEQALGAVASTTGGKYYFAEEAGKLSQIYANLGSEFAWRPVKVDATIPIVMLGALVVVAAAALSLWWFRVLP